MRDIDYVRVSIWKDGFGVMAHTKNIYT